jgi:transposase-like protein
MEVARAISNVFPDTVHMLCRFHLAQNISRKLVGSLKSKLNLFLDDFWRIESIEDVFEYRREFAGMVSKWPLAATYLAFLRSKEEKWAFAFTHRFFVAGIASTQRQEQVNCQIKSN